MTVLSQLQVLLTLDADEYAADIKRAQRETMKWGKKMERLGKTMSLSVTAPLVAMGGASVKAASDLNEAMNKVEVVFGDAAGEVKAFGRTSARSVGLSARAALEAAGTFGNLFTTIGMGKKPAADMSISLVKLAADLASFNNLNPEDVLEKLRSGLVGEVEPLRTLGINLNQTAVQAKAMEMGLADANGQVSQAALIQARYALILEQTRNAQGDFSRTSSALANSTRIMRAEFEDARAKLGQDLLPVAIDAVHTFNDLLDTFNAMPRSTRRMVVGLASIAAAAGPMVWGVGKAAQGVAQLSEGVAAAGGFKAYIAGLSSTAAKANIVAAAIVAVTVATYDLIKVGKELEAEYQRVEKVYKAHEIEMRRVANTYDDYIDEMLRSAVVSKKLKESGAERVRMAIAEGRALDGTYRQLGILTEAEWKQQHALAVEAQSFDQAMIASAQYRTEMAQAVQTQQRMVTSMDTAIQTQEQFKQGLDLLQQAIAGPVGKAYDDYTQKVADLRDRMGEVKQKIEALEEKAANNNGWLSKSDQQQLDDLRGEYGELQTSLDETTKAYERQRAEILYNIASKMILQALEAGLIKDMNDSGSAIDEAFGALTNLAKGLGLVDDKTVKTQENIGYLVGAFSDGKLSAEDFAREVERLNGGLSGIPKKVTSDIYINVHGQVPNIGGGAGKVTYYPQAKGGDWLVRRPTLFLAGEAGPERATFTPLGGGPKVGPAPARVQVIVPITYSPAVSLGDEVEMERVLGPFVAERVRDALARAGV